MTRTAALDSRFAIPNHVNFRETPDGMIVADIDNAHATASIALQGGQVMAWWPKTQAEPVVWLSPAAKLLPGKSIRGGVPVCWPWFGPHASDASLPAHGFARTVPWEVTETGALGSGETVIGLRLLESEQIRAQWPYRTQLSILICVGASLRIALTTKNDDREPFTIGEALHTYFQIGDIADIRVLGLQQCEYLDKVTGFARSKQSGPVTFAGETDRVYVNTEAECIIEDKRLVRRIRIAKSGSRSTVVWNPWAEKADKMGDLGPEGWRRMVCVESANALDNVVTVPPGATRTLAVEYTAEALP